jgi:hypothetical protein
MNIEINSAAESFGEAYSIGINGFLLYSAELETRNFFDSMLVLNRLHPDKYPRLALSRNLSFLSARYSMAYWDDQLDCWQEPSGFFRTKSLWKSHYQCHRGQDCYDIFTHPELRRSVYKNDCMIGYWEKEAQPLSDYVSYKLTADDDCEVELLISFCLILDTFTATNKQGLVPLELGDLHTEARPFDWSWKPKAASLDHLWSTSFKA